MSRNWIIFDIETQPDPPNILKHKCPPFNPDDVKLGNTKDPEKVAAKIKEAEASHLDRFAEKAALDPSTSSVLVLGLYDMRRSKEDAFRAIEVSSSKASGPGSEAEMLSEFWDIVCRSVINRCRMAGVNIFGFDLPYMVKRSILLEVPVPEGAWRPLEKWDVFDPDVFTDIAKVWQMGDRQASCSFDHIGKQLGFGGKVEGDCGKDFHLLWKSSKPKERQLAMNYLRNDVYQPSRWLIRMGLAQENLN